MHKLGDQSIVNIDPSHGTIYISPQPENYLKTIYS